MQLIELFDMIIFMLSLLSGYREREGRGLFEILFLRF